MKFECPLKNLGYGPAWLPTACYSWHIAECQCYWRSHRLSTVLSRLLCNMLLS